MADAGIAEWIGLGFLFGALVCLLFLFLYPFKLDDIISIFRRLRRGRTDKPRDEGY